MEKVVIVGSGGRLGAALARIYGAEFEVTGLRHADVDLNSCESVEKAVGGLDFDLLVNCAALTNVDYCETNEKEALRVNAEAPRELAEIAAKKGARMIHISTDYVFDGEKRTPYTEEDEAVAISIYGGSKLKGEEEVLEVSAGNLVVRVSWVFGLDRPSFIDGILKKALAEEKAEAIADKLSAPAFTLDLAEYLRPFLFDVREGGLLHLCNTGECSWMEYGQHALDCAGRLGAPLKATKVGALKMADLKAFIAKRPVYTVLDTGKFTRLTGMKARPWQEAVEAFVKSKIAGGMP